MEPEKTIPFGIQPPEQVVLPEFEQFRPHVSLPPELKQEDTAMKAAIVPIAISLAKQIIQMVSPELREMITSFVLQLELKAQETPNPIDNLLVGVLKTALDVKENAR